MGRQGLRTGTAALVGALLLAVGCTGGGDRTPAAPAPAAAQDSGALEFRWLQDSDGNAVPDFVETELGYDPVNDDCAGIDCTPAAAGGLATPSEVNTLLVLDASAVMSGDDGTRRSKLDAARLALERLTMSALPARRFGLAVLGGDGSGDPCGQLRPLAQVGQLTADTAPGTLAGVGAAGPAPLAAALSQVGQFLPPAGPGVANRVLLVAGGGEGCGGDPVAAAQALGDAGVPVTVLALRVERSADQQVLREVAERSGGQYVEAPTGVRANVWATEELAAAVRALRTGATCAGASGSDAGACDQDLALAAEAYLERERTTSTDPARQEALGGLIERVRTHAEGSSAARGGGPSPRAEELQGQADEILRRYRERFGPPLSPVLWVTPRCPAQASRA